MRNMDRQIEEGLFLANHLFVPEVNDLIAMAQKGNELCLYTLVHKSYAAGVSAGIRHEKKRQRELKKAARG